MAKLKKAVKKEIQNEILPIVWMTKFPLAFLFASFLVISAFIYYRKPDFVFAWQYFPHIFPDIIPISMPALTRFFYHTAIALWLIFLGFGFGYGLLHIFKFNFISKFEAFVFSMATGWGFMAVLMLVLGLFKLWYVGVIAGLQTVIAVPAVYGLYKWHLFKISNAETTANKYSLFEILMVVFFAACAAVNMVNCFIPDIFYDALIYHLALPDLYLIHHGIFATPHNLYSGVPMLTEMLYALGLALTGSEESAHIINWSMGIIISGMIVVFAERFLKNRKAGILAAVLFYSVPLAGVSAWKGFVDLTWTLFQTAAVYALAIRFETKDKKWIWLAALFTGFAMGAKYQAWPLAGILTAVIWFYLRRENGMKWQKEAIIFLSIVCAIMVLWPLKNFILYKNPIYPFFSELITGNIGGPDWKGLLNDGGSRNILKTFGTLAGIKSYFFHPWTELSAPLTDYSALGLLPFISLPFILFARPKILSLRILRVITILLWISWSLSSSMSRFFLPQIPLLALGTAVSVEYLFSRWLRYLVYIPLCFGILSNTLLTMTYPKLCNTDPVIFGRESKSQFLSRHMPSFPASPYPAIEFINNNLPDNVKVLFVGETRGFRMKRNYIASTIFDKNPVFEWLKASNSAEDFAKYIEEAGITHILLNKKGIRILQFDKKSILPAGGSREEKIYDEFAGKYLRRIFEFKNTHNPRISDPECSVDELKI